MLQVATPKPSKEELQKIRLKNLREGGELEADNETEQSIEQPEFVQFKSREEAEAYQQTLSANYKDDLRRLLNMPAQNHVEVGDRVYKAEELDSYQKYEAVKAIEYDRKVENKAEIKIGNTFEIRFNSQEQAIKPIAEIVNETRRSEDKIDDKKAPSALSEYGLKIDFGLLGKKSKESAFSIAKGITKGLFGGFKDIFDLVVPKKEVIKTPEQIANEKKKAASDSAFFQSVKAVMGEAQSFARQKLSQMQNRLGVGGMGAEGLNMYLGQTRNKSNTEVNTYTISEAARTAAEAQKMQQKRMEDIRRAETSKPVVNMQGMAEGGTAGGQTNLSSVASAG